jgi:hypothetical protein
LTTVGNGAAWLQTASSRKYSPAPAFLPPAIFSYQPGKKRLVIGNMVVAAFAVVAEAQ